MLANSLNKGSVSECRLMVLVSWWCSVCAGVLVCAQVYTTRTYGYAATDLFARRLRSHRRHHFLSRFVKRRPFVTSDVATTIPAFISSLSLPFYRHRGLHSRRRICRFRHLRTRRLYRPHHHTRRGSSSTSSPPPPAPPPSRFATTIPAFVAAAIASVIATVISAPVAASVVFIVRSRRLHRPHHHIPVAASIQPG